MRPNPRWRRRRNMQDAAQSDNQRVQALQNYTNVTAPLDGVVIWRYADTGALIQGGTNSNDQALPIVRSRRAVCSGCACRCPRTM